MQLGEQCAKVCGENFGITSSASVKEKTKGSKKRSSAEISRDERLSDVLMSEDDAISTHYRL